MSYIVRFYREWSYRQWCCLPGQDGKNKEELEENIKDAVECYFEVPHIEVDITIKYK